MKWWFSDYDGTINLQHNDYIDPRDMEFINKWIEEGNSFAIATGRMHHEIERVLDKVKIPYNYMICNNGAIVFEKGNGIIANTIIPFEEREEIVKIFNELKDRHILAYCLLDQRMDYSRVAVKEVDESEFLTTYAPKANNYDEGNHDILTSTDLNLLYVYLNQAEIENVQNIFNSRLKSCKAVRTHKNVIEIMHKDVSKAHGILKIKEIKGFSLDDVYTSGDGENDIEMLDLTKNSFTMREHQPKVKGHAKHVIDNVFEIGKYL
ncbi:Cof-type HAD-IIB family hydrolase [Spiroplasma culicicola]|uniref:HAD-superfamily hydrolase n=1 Tax=Spiroplasma culicicola AES-1 TaxID=1276246 RepID=W6A611_9MOLU|nr:Cof-type HAD-IIB family hydrolase [Spiroplasma culicicola]AHI52381.1 HAD-superfamily hydrolase [Spiroplasma culicicola AES-1]